MQGKVIPVFFVFFSSAFLTDLSISDDYLDNVVDGSYFGQNNGDMNHPMPGHVQW